jgi:hypothetical protein
LIKHDIPVTLLDDWLNKEAGEYITDPIAALLMLPPGSSDLLKEKAMASVALVNNKTSFLIEPHGFANICLIMNGVMPVVDYLPQVSVQYINYALWEIDHAFPDLVLHPNVANYVKACLETEDFVYPPDMLEFIGDVFTDRYGENSKVVAKFYQEYAKNPNAKEDIGKLDDYYRFQVGKLISVDSYTEKMKAVYKKYEDMFEVL